MNRLLLWFFTLVTCFSTSYAQQIWLEAECADLGSDWETTDDYTASGSSSIKSSNQSLNSPPGSDDAYATFTVESPQDATYALHGRVLASSESSNAFWVRANNGNWIKWDNIPVSRSSGFTAPAGKLPLIPGAVGFGMYGRAGRGGKILKVTNLNDSGIGSLRWALEQEGPRVVIFEVSGRIRLQDEITIWNPYLTVAGQTAPDPGIIITNAPIEVATSEVLIQHIGIFPGDDPGGRSYDNRDCITIGKTGYEVSNVVLDHVSLGWGTDENIDIIEGTDNITLRHMLIAEPLVKTRTGSRNAGYCLLIYGEGHLDITGSYFAHMRQRAPLTRIGHLVYANNVIYDRKSSFITMGNANGAGKPNGSTSQNTFVGNVFTEGPTLSSGTRDYPITVMQSAMLNNGSKIYVSDNSWSARNLDSQWDLVLNEPDYVKSNTPPAWVEGFVPKTNKNEIEDWVINNAGSRPARRNSNDKRIIENYLTGQGSNKDCVEGCSRNVGGWPSIARNTRSLNPPANPNEDSDGNGYTNLEEWLHGYARDVEGESFTSAGYKWDDVHNSNDNNRSISLQLNEGTNTIQIAYCEPETRLDKLFLTTDGNTPSGRGGDATNCNTAPPPIEDCDAPTDWQITDVGSPNLPGGVCAEENQSVFKVRASGEDIWGIADEFHYMYQRMNGDGEIVARIDNIENTHPWAKAGLMVRNSLEAGSQNAMMYISPTGRWAFQRRVNANTNTSSITSEEGVVSTPYWLKLSRIGNQISASYSSDGNDWQLAGTELIGFEGEVFIGLAVTSHDDFRNNISTFSQVSINPIDEPNPNQPNTPPVFSTSGDITADEDFEGELRMEVNPAPVPPAEAGQTPFYSISPSLNQVDFVEMEFDPSTGNLVILSIDDRFGSQTFTITATDGQMENSTHSESFTLTVNPVNDAPVFSLSNTLISLPQDFPDVEYVDVEPGDAPEDELGQSVTYELKPASIAFADISIDPQNGRISVSSRPGAIGQQSIQVIANDGQEANNIYVREFLLIVAENDCEAPTVWMTTDIGPVGLPGQVCAFEDQGYYNVRASGEDIWNAEDEFHFMYQELSGDGEIIARINSIDNTDPWAKAGVMMRTSMEIDAINAMMYVSPIGRWGFQYRENGGGNTQSNVSDPGDVQFPYWVRLQRSGNVLLGYYSQDGVSWEVAYAANLALNDTIYVGLGVTSHNDEQINTAQFEQVELIRSTPEPDPDPEPENQDPVAIPFRVNAGGGSYITSEEILFSADQYYKGSSEVIENSFSFTNTKSDPLYQSERSGLEFSYEIPILPGAYDIIVHFSEAYANASGERLFNVALEGREWIENYDVYQDAGKYTAALKLQESVLIVDSLLNIDFIAMEGQAKINAIEILPSAPKGRQKSVRINSGSDLEQVFGGQIFSADQYYNSSTVPYVNSNITDIGETSLDNLYRTSRASSTDFGTVSYNIPVVNGEYIVYVYAAETYYGAPGGQAGSAGSRVMDIEIEGTEVEKNLDLYISPGPMKAWYTEANVTVTDGVLNLNVVPLIGKASVAAIEVLVPEDQERSISRFSNQNIELDFDVAAINPSPAENQTKLYLSGPIRGDFTLRIFDSMGNMVHERITRKDREKQSYDINLQRYPKGLYFIEVAQFGLNVHARLLKN